jgi:hypothetical protein
VHNLLRLPDAMQQGFEGLGGPLEQTRVDAFTPAVHGSPLDIFAVLRRPLPREQMVQFVRLNLALWEPLPYAFQERMHREPLQRARSDDLQAGFRSLNVDSLNLLLLTTQREGARTAPCSKPRRCAASTTSSSGAESSRRPSSRSGARRQERRLVGGTASQKHGRPFVFRRYDRLLFSST